MEWWSEFARLVCFVCFVRSRLTAWSLVSVCLVCLVCRPSHLRYSRALYSLTHLSFSFHHRPHHRHRGCTNYFIFSFTTRGFLLGFPDHSVLLIASRAIHRGRHSPPPLVALKPSQRLRLVTCVDLEYSYHMMATILVTSTPQQVFAVGK